MLTALGHWQEEKRKLCEQLDLQMLALKRTRPSIAACTAIAIAAAHKGGAGQVRLAFSEAAYIPCMHVIARSLNENTCRSKTDGKQGACVARIPTHEAYLSEMPP